MTYRTSCSFKIRGYDAVHETFPRVILHKEHKPAAVRAVLLYELHATTDHIYSQHLSPKTPPLFSIESTLR